jgi:hypothetical protein
MAKPITRDKLLLAWTKLPTRSKLDKFLVSYFSTATGFIASYRLPKSLEP